MRMRAAAGRMTALTVWLGWAVLAQAQPPSAPQVPDPIRVAPGEQLLLLAHASGAQIYLCTQAAGGQWQWTLKAPDAELRNEQGTVIIHHSAGPSWRHNDGSEVTGKAVAHVASPDADAVAWLLLSAVSHEGSGVLARVSSIQRIHTHGGQPPPAAQCDATRGGAEVRIPYTADYYFYAPAGPAAH
jgi:hypothetical protein